MRTAFRSQDLPPASVPADRDRQRRLVEYAVLAAVTLFVFWRLRPSLIFADTLPAGGDLSSHSWGPDFLRSALPGISGWSWDWFAGFPAYVFYPVLPPLLVNALDLLLPYGVAMKVVIAAGPLSLPAASWAFARWWRLSYPAPPLFAIASLVFLFDSTQIHGAAIRSTIVGEYSYSLGLPLGVLALGLCGRVLDRGQGCALAALACAAAALAHPLTLVFVLVGILGIVVVHLDRRRELVTRVGPVLAVGLALSGIWWFPFALQRGFMTSPDFPRGPVSDLLAFGWVSALMLAVAVVGAVLALQAGRRVAGVLVTLAASFGLLFLVLPVGQMHNTRVLSFWSWSHLMLAALGIVEIGTWVGKRLADRPVAAARVLTAAPVAALVVVLLPISLIWKIPPFGDDREYGPDNTIDYAFSGYQRAAEYSEYRGLMDTLDRLGQERGCGRFSWTHDVSVTDYGNVANDLAPYWTDGCISSLSGLYFDSSATTPFISMTLSLTGIRSVGFVPGLPYKPFDLADGVRHLRYLGVRYFAVRTDDAIAQSGASPELAEVAATGNWRVYELRNSAVVAPLRFEPVVLQPGVAPWDRASVAYTETTPRWDQVLLAKSGPDAWRRIEARVLPPDRALAPVTVSDTTFTSDGLRFRVDRVGVPILVKASYFPTWEAKGAEGPYRVAGNMMVVVPTAQDVVLSHRRSAGEWLGLLSFLAGIGGTLALALQDRRGQRTRRST